MTSSLGHCTRSSLACETAASRTRSGARCAGSFTFSEDGDPVASAGATVAITVYKATDKLTTVTTIAPKQTTVDAALGK